MAGLKSMGLGKLRRCVGGRRLVCPIQWSPFKRYIVIPILLLSVLPYTGFGLDYTIKEVIEVGEADFVPFLGPLKWSPDGTKLAFFKSGVLKISDTLGKVNSVTNFGVAPHRYDFVSNGSIALHFRSFPGPSINTEEKLVLVDVSTGQLSTIHEFTTTAEYRKVPNKTTSSGPYETVEGSKFYLYTTYNAPGDKTIVERRSFLNNKTDLIANEHIACWGRDGLYLVNLTGKDSTRIAYKPFERMGSFPKVRSDLRYASDGGLLFNIEDSILIVLDTMLGPLPPNTVECGVLWFSFNPAAEEAAFTISCDDGVNYVTHRIATFDFQTTQMTVLDTLIAIYDCGAPAYSPDGRKIAFLANGRAFIMMRLFK